MILIYQIHGCCLKVVILSSNFIYTVTITPVHNLLALTNIFQNLLNYLPFLCDLLQFRRKCVPYLVPY